MGRIKSNRKSRLMITGMASMRRVNRAMKADAYRKHGLNGPQAVARRRKQLERTAANH